MGDCVGWQLPSKEINTIKVPWQFDFKLPSKAEANNGYMLMNVLRFYLQSQSKKKILFSLQMFYFQFFDVLIQV